MAAPSDAGVTAPDEPQTGGDLPQTFFLGRYRVVDEIGVGGMASVHLARVDGPGGFQKWVAIKRIHPHLVEDDQFVDMFLDEARIAAGINHANVAQVFDLGKDDNTYWIAMEYLHGEPLREVMRRVDESNGHIPTHVASRIVADAAEGLHGAHELRGRNGQLLNLVHRDVTPHNLFVTYEGYTKVVDFGIAKVVDRLASTRAGTLKGKLAYMSPEQVRGQEVDRRTDIFALGVVLWELTTGRRLFRMDTDLDTLEKVQACVVPLPTTVIDGFPVELQEVVMRALAQRREDRFQTAREFSRALQRVLMKQGTFVGPEDVGEYVKTLFTDRVRKRERYLEWAAEVTSAVDVDQLRAQGAAADAGGAAPAQPYPSPSESHVRAAEPHAGHYTSPSHAHPGAAPPRTAPMPQAPHANPYAAQQQGAQQQGAHYPGAMAAQPPRPYPAPQHHHAAPLPPQQMRSHGENAAAAALVTSAPIHPHDLAATSLMDEDEDIPTVVAAPRGPESEPGKGPRPAAGMGRHAPPPMPHIQHQQQWNGSATQLMGGDHAQGFDSTIALPDSSTASEISSKVDELDRQIMQHHRPPSPPMDYASQVPAMHQQPPPQYPGGYNPPNHQQVPNSHDPGMSYDGAMHQSDQRQGAIETKMSLPRPAAVAQWLMEQGDVEIGGPRSTGVIIAIAALATLCVMGVISLIVHKLRVPPQPDPASVTAPQSSTGSLLPSEVERGERHTVAVQHTIAVRHIAMR